MYVYVALGNIDYEGSQVLGVGFKKEDANLIIKNTKRKPNFYDNYSIEKHSIKGKHDLL